MKKMSCVAMAFALLLFISCSNKGLSAEEVLNDVCPDLNLSAGHLYLSNSEEGSEHYMSPALFSVMFGREKPEAVKEYAVFASSFDVPFEIAVFKCYSSSSCDEVERLCLSRLDVLKRFYKDSEYSYIIDDAFVMHDGNFAIMVVSENEKDISSALKKILH